MSRPRQLCITENAVRQVRRAFAQVGASDHAQEQFQALVDHLLEGGRLTFVARSHYRPDHHERVVRFTAGPRTFRIYRHLHEDPSNPDLMYLMDVELVEVPPKLAENRPSP